ncbi:hypothetical protein [Nocardioides dongkuii]|uniref:hypothetical protein n=1 Tax=Nocardioides dongkuii TaxID=2760089 RepID=UPI0015FE21FF|nr:hypothetical protein [Nocardioides dongkuii]
MTCQSDLTMKHGRRSVSGTAAFSRVGRGQVGWGPSVTCQFDLTMKHGGLLLVSRCPAVAEAAVPATVVMTMVIAVPAMAPMRRDAVSFMELSLLCPRRMSPLDLQSWARPIPVDGG